MSFLPASIVGSTAANKLVEETKVRVPARTLGQDDFLKLVIAKLANQDPLKPQEDTEFIAQMAQFTTLEQTKSMQSDIAQMRAQQQVLQGMSLLNRQVAVSKGDGTSFVGVVDKLEMEGDSLKLVIGGQKYDLKDVVEVGLQRPE
jgi:flagellar basal-body rod modification protein FlgD